MPDPKIYYLPEEGLITSISDSIGIRFYTRRGLEHRLLDRQQKQQPVDQEEQALRLIKLYERHPYNENIIPFERALKDASH